MLTVDGTVRRRSQTRLLTDCRRRCSNSGSDPYTSDCRFGSASFATILNHRATSPKCKRQNEPENPEQEEREVNATHHDSSDGQTATRRVWSRLHLTECDEDRKSTRLNSSH